MPKTKKGGKKSGRKRSEDGGDKRQCPFATEDQVYGVVDKLLGDRRVAVKCIDGVERLGKIRGAMAKRVWIARGDTVLVALRSFQDPKGDIIYRYAPEEVSTLRKAGEIMAEKPVETAGGPSLPDGGFEFTDEVLEDLPEEVDIDAI